MKQDDWNRLRDIYARAVDLDGGARERLLADECADDPELRSQLESLLAVETEAIDWYLTPLQEVADRLFSDRELLHAGESVGAFRIERELGSGGMGIVYLAQQEEPIRRRVALKIIKLGMDTREVLRRFDTERQVLTMLDHPHVARAIDAGVTDDGRPYFVMEYVDGQPITAYCDAQRLSTMQRIELFRQVCDGVQHAHQNGVIHRDLKPSNILVADRDGTATSKIIDFGVAKAVQARRLAESAFTELGQLIGTPEYMSPEQACLTDDPADTRSDVYALGMVLYELLAGALPFDRSVLRGAGLEGVLHHIRETEPSPPSVRVSAGGIDAEKAAANRRSEPGELARLLRGELDWIVMRALDKQPERRYGSARELERDLACHLAGLPVAAGPPGAGYRVRKFLARHRVATGLVAAVLLALIAFSLLMSFQVRRTARERDRANLAATTAAEVSDFLIDIFRRSHPDSAHGEPLTAREILALGAGKLDALDDQPLIQARLQETVGIAYLELGEYAEAARLFEASLNTRRAHLPADSAEVLSTASALGSAYREQGRHADAEPLLREVLAARRDTLGPDDRATLSAANNLALLYWTTGRYDQAERLYADTAASSRRILGDDHPLTLSTLNNLAAVFRDQGRLSEARELFAEVVERRSAVLGNEHSDTLTSRNNLASILADQGEYAAAEKMWNEVLDSQQRILGADHPETLRTCNNLAALYEDTGRNDRALALYTVALEGQQRVLGPDHQETLATRSNLAHFHFIRHEYATAARLYEEVLEARRRVLGQDHPETFRAYNNLAVVYRSQGRYGEAEPLFRRALEGRRRVLGSGHPATLTSMYSLSRLLLLLDRKTEAEALLRDVVAGRREALGPDDRHTVAAVRALAELYRSTGRPARADALLAGELDAAQESP